MRDFDYDVWQKKIIASGAKYKKGGAKSRKCTLPHENLTAKELKERNGKMATYNLNKPMTWEEFKAMPTDLQLEYMNKLKNALARIVQASRNCSESAQLQCSITSRSTAFALFRKEE